MADENGLVVCTFLREIADRETDENPYPDRVAARGSIWFRKTSPLSIDQSVPAFVQYETIEGVLDPLGVMVTRTAAAQPGVWLSAGVWGVSFQLKDDIKVKGFNILVTGSNDESNPIDLSIVAPHIPGPTDAVLVVKIPATIGADEVLVRGADNSFYGVPLASIGSGGGAGTWDDLSGKPPAIAAGDTPQDARDAIGAVGTGDSRLGDARPPTPHQHAVEQLTDSTLIGRQVLTAASPSAARSAIGAGTSNLVIGAGAGQAATGVQGARADTAVQPDQLDAALESLGIPDDAVTDAKVADDAGISLDKTADTAARIAFTPSERLKLSDLESGLTRTANQGIVQIDSFPGVTDADKLDAAISYAMAQSKIPWLQLPPRVFNTGSRSFVGASGLKIIGPGVVGAPLNIEVAGESLIPGKWRTTAGNGTSSLIAMPTGTEIYNQCLVNIAFHGNTNTQIVHSPTNAYVCWYHSLTLYGCGGGIGSGISSANRFLGTQCRLSGHWMANAHANAQIYIGGSDWFIDMYFNCNSGPANQGDGSKANIIFQQLSKTNVAYLYITNQGDWTGLRIAGDTRADVVIFGGTFEGRSTSNLATRPPVDVQGGTVTMYGPHFSNVSAAVETVKGAVHQSGGTLILDSPTYRRGDGVPADFPLLYQTGGRAEVRSPRALASTGNEQIRVRWASETVETVPLFANRII